MSNIFSIAKFFTILIVILSYSAGVIANEGNVYIRVAIPTDFVSKAQNHLSKKIKNFKPESDPHCTLVFIGKLSGEDKEKLGKNLENIIDVIRHHRKKVDNREHINEIYLEQGAYRMGNSNAVVVTLNCQNSDLEEIVNKIKKRLKNLGVSYSALSFKAHVTLGRIDVDDFNDKNLINTIKNTMLTNPNSQYNGNSPKFDIEDIELVETGNEKLLKKYKI